jgi:hypothetical protein
MGATTIAEGVETSSQLRTARHLGITAGQGYLLGRPGAERDLTWVDIAALEQRDGVGIPVTPDLAELPNLGGGQPVPPAGGGPAPTSSRNGERRTEPVRWAGAPPIADADNPLLPPLDATGHLVGGGRGALSFLRAGSRQSGD